jgi:hypothetical protein
VAARTLGDLVLAFHLAFIVFAVLGGFLVLWRPWIAWLHVPSVLWSGYVNLFGQVCPLTPLENRFRYVAGQAGYEGGFIQHYLAPLVYPGVMPERWGLISGFSVLIWNVLVYMLVVAQQRSEHLRTARIAYRGGRRVQEGKPRPTTGGAVEAGERVSWWWRMFGE